jgi:glycogenin
MLLILGGDQGLLNTFFPAYHRLSFTYNVTPSTNYQYTPAYRHFSSNISLFHFIGKSKPWSQRSYSGGDSNNEATGRWWSVYEKHFGWKIREDELRRNQEKAIQRGQTTAPRSRSAEPYQQPMHSIIAEPSSRPSTADKASKHVSFGSTDTTFSHPAAPPPVMSSIPSYQAPPMAYQAPPMERQPSPPPFEPKMVTWDPARSAPPADSEPEAKNLSIGAYQSAWDKPYNPNEPKWVPPPRSPLPKGFEYTPPAPPPESHDTSSDSEDEEVPAVKSSRYSTSDSDISEDKGHQQPQERINPVFPWEMRGPRPNATRVFPDDVAPNSAAKVSEARPYDRRASLDTYEFTNAYDLISYSLILVGTPFQ